MQPQNNLERLQQMKQRMSMMRNRGEGGLTSNDTTPNK